MISLRPHKSAKNTDRPPESDLPAGLSAPARRALAGAGISHLAQLTRLTESEVKKLHGIGPNALAQLRQALAARGISYRDPGA